MNKLIIVTCLGILFGYSSCESHKEKHQEESTFQVTHPIRMDTSINKDYVAQIKSIQHIELRALERGYLQSIYIDEGQSVKKGQKLFQIMPRVYEAELQKSKAEVNFAEIEYENTKRLADSDVVAPNELAMAKAKLEKAKAELALAQVHLDFTEIRAPFDGIIDRFHARIGSLLDEGDLLTHLSDNSKMWIYFNVPETEYLEYQENMKKDSVLQVSLLMANNKMFKHPGVVETIEADFNNETGNIPFRATFSNPEGLLRHGETGNIQIRIPLRNALLIPQKATYEVLDKNYVFVIDEEHRVRARRIIVGEEMPHLFVVKEGLSENDIVLLEGLRLVHENDEIQYDLLEPSDALAQLDLYAE